MAARGQHLSKKPAVHELFGDDSDDEKGDPVDKKSKAMATASLDPEEQKAADKLAEFVAKNGRNFEDITRQRNPGDTPFRFLWNKASAGYRYYDTKVKEHERALEKTAAPRGSYSAPQAGDSSRSRDPHPTNPTHSSSSGGGGRHDRHDRSHSTEPTASSHRSYSTSSSSRYEGGDPSAGRKRNRWGSDPKLLPPPSSSVKLPPAAPPLHAASSGGGGGSGAAASSEGFAAALAAAQAAAAAAKQQPGQGGGSSSGSSTVVAMEQYMQRLAKASARASSGDEDEEEGRERKRSQPFLKETGFDRRKVVAVYKETGERGHHMQDFIPPEELAKFMADCGDSSAKAKLQQLEQKSAIGADNIGHKLLQKMGWKEGQGLGGSQVGATAPVAASVGGPKQDNLGLGAQAHGAVEFGDDMYEQYRKRMMLGYKYRPNPLGNPRKQYY